MITFMPTYLMLLFVILIQKVFWKMNQLLKLGDITHIYMHNYMLEQLFMLSQIFLYLYSTQLLEKSARGFFQNDYHYLKNVVINKINFYLFILIL